MATVDVSEEEIQWLIQKRAQNIVAVSARGASAADELRALLTSIFDLTKYLPSE